MSGDELISKLAEATGYERRKVESLIGTFASVLADKASTLDSIALPGFGNFISVKQAERVDVDQQGNRTLVPPQIRLEFLPSALLKNSIPQ